MAQSQKMTILLCACAQSTRSYRARVYGPGIPSCAELRADQAPTAVRDPGPVICMAGRLRSDHRPSRPLAALELVKREVGLNFVSSNTRQHR